MTCSETKLGTITCSLRLAIRRTRHFTRDFVDVDDGRDFHHDAIFASGRKPQAVVGVKSPVSA